MRGGHHMPGQLLTIKQVQERLQVSYRTIFNLIEREELKGFKVGKNWRFEESDIEDYIRRQREKSEKKEPEPSAA